MFRSIATLSLLIAQAAAWGSATQFRCVDSAGGVCFDGGPRSCHCCDEDASVATSHDHEGHDHSDHAICEGLAVSAGDCDCSHELIARDGTFNVSRSTPSTLLHEAQQVVAPFAVAVDPQHLDFIAMRLATDAAALSAPPLILLSPVALRC